PFLVAPRGISRISVHRRAELFLRQRHALSEERDVHTPFVGAAAARAGAVDHDLAVAERERAAIEQAAGAKAIPDARNASQRREERQWRHAGRHDRVEHLLKLGRIWRRDGLHARCTLGSIVHRLAAFAGAGATRSRSIAMPMAM